MPETNESLEYQFAQIREETSEFDRTLLPEQVELPLNRDFDSKDLLNLATAFWQRIYNQDEFLQVLRRYISLSPEQKSKATKEKQYFKKLRKAGLIYKSAFRFGDERRNLPDDMDNFLVKLGEFGDYFYHEHGQKIGFELLLLVNEKNFLQPVEDSQYASLAEVRVRIDWIVQKCQKFMFEKKLEVNDFHKMRKLLRHVMNLYQLAAVARQDDMNIRQTFQFICDLNSMLGDEHDEAVKNDISGKAKYDEQEILLDDAKMDKVEILLIKLKQALSVEEDSSVETA